jgi:hypothetical protein
LQARLRRLVDYAVEHLVEQRLGEVD